MVINLYYNSSIEKVQKQAFSRALTCEAESKHRQQLDGDACNKILSMIQNDANQINIKFGLNHYRTRSAETSQEYRRRIMLTPDYQGSVCRVNCSVCCLLTE